MIFEKPKLSPEEARKADDKRVEELGGNTAPTEEELVDIVEQGKTIEELAEEEEKGK